MRTPLLAVVLSTSFLLFACDASVPPEASPEDAGTSAGGDGGNGLVPTADAGTGMISAGPHHTCGVNAAGEVFCWGRNSYEELGNGTGVGSPLPVRANISEVRTVSVGNQATCAIKRDGTLWCWGRIVSEMPPPTPLEVLGLPSTPTDVWTVGAGGLVRVEDGRLWRLQQGLASTLYLDEAVTTATVGDAVCIVKPGGELWCLGDNASGSVGDGTLEERLEFVPISLPSPVSKVASGGNYTCAVDSLGDLYCWGDNSRGQLGSRTSTSMCNWSDVGAAPCTPTPTKVQGLPLAVEDVVTGYDFTAALLVDGTVWAWGGNNSEETGGASTETCTGPGDFTNPCVPEPRLVPLNRPMKQLSAGSDHTCACAADGTAWCWGSTSSGVLGTGNVTTESLPPVQVRDFGCE